MRFVFLIPELDASFDPKRSNSSPIARVRRLFGSRRPSMKADKVYGGTLNLMRHCALCRSLGVDAVLATETGIDTYGRQWGIAPLPFIRWADRRPDDICVVPDVFTWTIDQVEGPCIAYQQTPRHLHHDFDYRRADVALWTDSPFMLEACQRAYPGESIQMVPNIVDHRAFPFIPQHSRTPGELLAFPRKGRDFIDETFARYRARGGSYWKLSMIDGLSLYELAERFRTPQAFLASADVEGCALPPQEAMAAGILVVGKDARGANFCMEHERTALVANTVEEVANALFRAEDAALRATITEGAYAYIQRYFDDAQPAQFWRERIGAFEQAGHSRFRPSAAAAGV